MPYGKSDRIVFKVEPGEKQALYELLENNGLTLKDWLLGQTRHYLHLRNKTELFHRKDPK